MKKRWIPWIMTGAVCAATGCDGQMGELPVDGTPAAEGFAAIEGRIDANSGNQHSGIATARSAGIEADSVTAISVDNTVLAEAPVVDGSFRLDAFAPIDAPFFIEARSDGQLTGRVLMPLGAQADERVRAMPISAETTAEAAAFEALAAEGESVDPIALMGTITHEMAATAEAETLAAAAMAAQTAERAALDAHTRMAITAEAMSQIRANAFERLVAALDAAESPADEAGAWADFHGESALALQAALGADAEARADAAAAAGFALAGTLLGQAGYDAAVTFAAEAAARAEYAVMIGLTTANADARRAVDAAFAGHAAALANAGTASDAQSAHDTLVEALGGQEAPDRSALVALASQAGIAGSTLVTAQAAAIEITVDTRARIAAQSAGGAEQAGAAYAGLRTAVQGAIRAEAGAIPSAAVVELLAEIVLADAALPSPALVEDVGPPEGEGEPEINVESTIEAVLEGGAALQPGAQALVDGLRVNIEGESARVLAIGADGQAQLIAQGEVIADRARVELPGGADVEGLVVFQVMQGHDVVAAAVLPELPAAGETVELPPLSAESTVEALLALRAAADDHLDLAFVQRMLDDATATAALAEGRIEELGTALWTAQSTFADALHTESAVLAAAGADASAALVAELAAGGQAAADAQARFEAELVARIEQATGATEAAQRRAMAEAAAAFEATLIALTDGQAELTIAAADAQGQLVNTAHAVAGLQGQLQAEGRAHAAAFVEAAQAHADAIAAADHPAAVAAAGAELREAWVGEVDGVTANLVAEARLDIVSRSAVESALGMLAAADARLSAALELAVVLDGSGAVSVGETAASTAEAFARFEASARAAAESMARVPDFEGPAATIVALWTATSTVNPGE